MKTVRTEFAKRLMRALELRDNMSQTELAHQLTKTLRRRVRPSVVQFLCSKANGSQMTADIARILRVEYDWLAYGTGPMTRGLLDAGSSKKSGEVQRASRTNSKLSHDEARTTADDAVEPLSEFEDALDPLGPLKTRTVAAPVVGTASLGFDGFWSEIEYPVGYGDGYVMHPTRDANAYALQVKGDSMYPAIRSGFIVVVEPNTTPVIGEFVVVKLKDGRSTVKELLWQRGDEFALQAVNGQARMTLRVNEVEFIHYVAAIVPPSRRSKI